MSLAVCGYQYHFLWGKLNIKRKKGHASRTMLFPFLHSDIAPSAEEDNSNFINVSKRFQKSFLHYIKTGTYGKE